MGSKYLFVQQPDDGNCPEGTKNIPLVGGGVKINTCMTPCDTSNCKGYPGLSVTSDNFPQLTWNGTSKRFNDAFVFQVDNKNPNKCKACWENGISCDTGLDAKCCGLGAAGENCDVGKGLSSKYVLQNIKYSGDNCETPCDPTNPDNCNLRMAAACTVTPPIGWSCDNSTKKCVNDGGKYVDQTECQADQTSQCYTGGSTPSGNEWACQNATCTNVGVGNGVYNSQADCQADTNSDCYTSNKKSGNMITIILSVVAGIILLAIIGMFVYLFITGKKRKMNRGNMRSVS